MEPFLDRFCELVDDNLGDPVTSKRYPRAKKLRDLRAVERQIWERLKVASGQESVIGRAEATLTVVEDQEFYLLPGNFGQFVSLTNDTTYATIGSVPNYDEGPGIVLLSEQRGMQWKPAPTDVDAGDWTLVYQKAPIKLHYATAGGVSADTITFGTPASSDAGELILADDYYNGSLIRIYSADLGISQVREVVDFRAESKVAILRHPWSPQPTGEVKYEICPLLPEDYDDLYALDITILGCTRRAAFTRRAHFIRQRRELWNACIEYFTNNAADRAATRMLPEAWDELDVYEQ